MHRLTAILIAAILCAPCVIAATLHGTVYDFDLTERNNSIVTVNTVPRQQVVAKTGTYSFTLPPGAYNLTATYAPEGLSVDETITIRDDGDYVLDLILFPDLSEQNELLTEDVDLSGVDVEESTNSLWYIIGAVALAGVAGIIYWKQRKGLKHKRPARDAVRADESLDEPMQEVMKALAKEDGRITQRDLRTALPYSEAKISLIITDLESRGMVRKIKKGRGNIIVKL